MKNIEISNSLLRAVLLPGMGGHIGTLQYNHPDRGWLDLFVAEREAPSYHQNVPLYGCFQMVPFANRMVDGVLQDGAQGHVFPINWPDEGVAIHGTGWSETWAVAAQSETSATLNCQWSSDTGPYHYEADFSVSIEGNAIDFELKLTNRSAQPLPMGMGFHPWFSDVRHAQVHFDASLTPVPNSPWALFPDNMAVDLPPEFVPQDHVGIDSCFTNWGGHLDIHLNAKDIAIQMDAAGDLTHMHVYVAGAMDRFCLEPVSHVPGQIEGKNAEVLPGQSISGGMRLAVSTLT